MASQNSTTKIGHEELLQWLKFDPDTGVFAWAKSGRGSVKAGSPAGGIDVSGYVQLRLLGRIYKGHRLAWFYVYRQWPNGDIDHINGVRNDNRIANLRVVTNAINCQNKRSPLPGNKTGFLGVHVARGKYRAAIMLNNKQHHLGRFDTPEAAHKAYVEAKRKIHKGCAI